MYYISILNAPLSAQMCSRKLIAHTACKFEKRPVLKLKGLCKSAPMDLFYDLAFPTPILIGKKTIYSSKEDEGLQGLLGGKLLIQLKERPGQ